MKLWAKQKGFTIVELLIVIVVIAILAAISIVAYNGIQNRANNNAIVSTVASYVKMLTLYKSEHGDYPGGSTNLVACFDGTISCWSGADQAKSTTLNTELKKVASAIPSLPQAGFNYTVSNGYYIIFRLVDTPNCPTIGGTTVGTNDVSSGQRNCRVILPASQV